MSCMGPIANGTVVYVHLAQYAPSPCRLQGSQNYLL